MPQPATAPTRAERRGVSPALLGIGFFLAAVAPLIAARLTLVEPAPRMHEFATGLGLAAGALLLLQFLSSGRYHRLSGRIGIDRTMGFHRIAALVLMGLAVLHPAGYVLATAISDPSAAGERLLGLFISPRLRTGVLALLILSVLTLYATLRTSPKVRYEIWRATHGLLAVMAAALMLHHAMIAGAYSREWLVLATWGALATAALVAVLLVYVVRPRRLRQETWALVEVAPDGTGAWELTLRGPSSTRLRFRGGQFVWLSLASRTMPWYDHPFSIASAPAQLPDLRLLIREAGDFTSHVGALPTGTLFVLDGPHGSFVLEDGEGTVVMIAGGVGIAPILGMLEEAANAGVRRRFHLLYAGRTPAGLAGLQRLKALKERLDLEIGLFVDDPGTPPAAGFASGPISRADIARSVADPRSTIAYVCGPPRMLETMADALLELGVPATRVHYERFDYGGGSGRLDRRRRAQALAVLAAVVIVVATFGLVRM